MTESAVNHDIMRLPEQAAAKIMQLREIVEKHPDYIPLLIAAGFLGIDPEGLRASIEQGRCPFGIEWQKKSKVNRGFKIPAPTFFIWYTCGAGYR